MFYATYSEDVSASLSPQVFPMPTTIPTTPVLPNPPQEWTTDRNLGLEELWLPVEGNSNIRAQGVLVSRKKRKRIEYANFYIL